MNPIFKRTSVREYDDAPIGKKKVEKILRAAMQAPSAGNQQPWEFVVVDEPELLDKLSACSPYASPTSRAPLAIVPLMRTEGLRFGSMREQDMGACVENILLEATKLGIGSVWQAIYPEPDRVALVSTALGLSKDLEPFCIVALGYPADGTLPEQKRRYDAARVHFNGYQAR